MKRGQAALDFLTTYGWAFMLFLVFFGALAYWGVITPCRLLPDSHQCHNSSNSPPEIVGITCEKITPPTKVIITDEGKDTIYYHASCDFMEKEEWLWCSVR